MECRSSRCLLICTLTVSLGIATAFSQDVLTYHNSNYRNGLFNTETTLTPVNVKMANFGKLFSIPTDGLVDAQPLFLSSVTIAGAAHNVLIVATEHGTVYAVNADTGAIFWKVTSLKSGETTSDSRGCNQVTPEIGVTSPRHQSCRNREAGHLSRRNVQRQIRQLPPTPPRSGCHNRRRSLPWALRD